MKIIKWYSIIILSFVLISATYQNCKKEKYKDNFYIGITLVLPILYMLFN